jgi:hypothetical protein
MQMQQMQQRYVARGRHLFQQVQVLALVLVQMPMP